MEATRWSSNLFGISLCLLLFASQPVLADKVTLKNGKVLEGIIVEEEPQYIRVEIRGTRIDVQRADIGSMERIDRAANALIRGDNLLEHRLYDDAITAYREALADKAEIAKARIAAAEAKRDATNKSHYAALPLEQAEKQAREALVRPRLDAEQIAILQKQLADILIRKADDAAIHFRYTLGVQALEEAWRLVPGMPGLALKYAEALEKLHPDDPKVIEVLDLHLAQHKDDMEAGDLWVRKMWKKNPWGALQIIYPHQELNPRATPAMREALPEVLLLCFNRKPYPADAPFDRVSCYERYMELNPKADRKPLLQARLDKNPDDAKNLYDMALYDIEADRLEEAKTRLEEITKKFPEFAEAKTQLGEMESKMLERDIRAEEKTVDEMTTQLQKALSLAELDFPLSANKGEWLARAAGARKLLEGRPDRSNFLQATKYLEALQEYETYCKDNGKPVAQALGEAENEKKQVEADKQHEQSRLGQEQRTEMNRRRDELLRSYLFGEAGRGKKLKPIGGWSRDVTSANGTVREIYYKELKIYSLGDRLELHARNVHFQGDVVLSGDIIYPPLNQVQRVTAPAAMPAVY